MPAPIRRPPFAGTARRGLGVHSSASWALKCRRLLAILGEHGGVLPLRSFLARCFLAPVRRNGEKRPYSMSSTVSGKASRRLDGDQGLWVSRSLCPERFLFNRDLVKRPSVNRRQCCRRLATRGLSLIGMSGPFFSVWPLSPRSPPTAMRANLGPHAGVSGVARLVKQALVAASAIRGRVKAVVIGNGSVNPFLNTDRSGPC
jgi:hypothetical protein